MANVAGLRQYCIAYPQFWAQAEEIERLYQVKLATRPHVPVFDGAGGAFAGREPKQESTMGQPGGYAEQQSVAAPAEATGANEPGKNGHGSDRVRGVAGQGKDISMALFEWLHQP